MANFLITCIILAAVGLPVIILTGIYEWFVTKTKVGRAFEKWLFDVLDIEDK